MRNRASSSSDTLNPAGLTDPWASTETAHTTTPHDPTSPYVDTTVSPFALLSDGRLGSIIHPASLHIDPMHIHSLSAIFQRLVCSPDLSHITKSATTILIPDADQTWPKESQVHEILTITQLQPKPFDEGSATFQGELVACWGYEHTPPLSPNAPQTWLPFLRQKYRILFERLISSERPHAVIPIHITQNDFEIQAHILSIIHALTLINDKHVSAPHTFSVTFLLPNQPTSQSFYQSICHWSKTFTAHKHDYTHHLRSSYNFNTTRASHFSPFSTPLSVPHPPATHSNSTSNSNLPSSTSYGQPPTAPSTTSRLLNCLA